MWAPRGVYRPNPPLFGYIRTRSGVAHTFCAAFAARLCARYLFPAKRRTGSPLLEACSCVVEIFVREVRYFRNVAFCT